METNNNKTIVAFHIGICGRSQNAGHRTFIGRKKIGDFTEDLFLQHENIDKFKDRFGFDRTGDSSQMCILDLISNKDYCNLEEKFGITEEMLGEMVYYASRVGMMYSASAGKIVYYVSGRYIVGLTEREAETGLGRIDIDGEYNTTYTCYLDECDRDEVALIKQSKDYINNESLYESIPV